jgi:tryptophanyl-tRNA synthetase
MLAHSDTLLDGDRLAPEKMLGLVALSAFGLDPKPKAFFIDSNISRHFGLKYDYQGLKNVTTLLVAYAQWP